jgi:hypothetical protein
VRSLSLQIRTLLMKASASVRSSSRYSRKMLCSSLTVLDGSTCSINRSYKSRHPCWQISTACFRHISVIRDTSEYFQSESSSSDQTSAARHLIVVLCLWNQVRACSACLIFSICAAVSASSAHSATINYSNYRPP